MSDAMVQVRDLSKRYRKSKRSRSWWGRLTSMDRSPPEYHVAVDGVSFEIQAGEIFGLLAFRLTERRSRSSGSLGHY